MSSLANVCLFPLSFLRSAFKADGQDTAAAISALHQEIEGWYGEYQHHKEGTTIANTTLTTIGPLLQQSATLPERSATVRELPTAL